VGEGLLHLVQGDGITLPAPLSAAPAMAASPTPPQPMTATDSPGTTAPVLTAAP
jgi:hypothetical protein